MLAAEREKVADAKADLEVVIEGANKKEKKLQDDLKEAEKTVEALKESTKAAHDSEYVMTRKLLYEKQVRRDLEIDLVVAMQTLQNDQITIAGLEAEMADLQEAAGYNMDMVVPRVNPEESSTLLDRLIVAPDRVTELLRSTGTTAAVGALSWVKLHFPDVDVGKLMDGPNEDADLHALELEVQAGAEKVVEHLDL
ncbi:uncharacterized protein LOC120682321 isoform X1 [Panicum virgatum]|nr:uncharacterized protein LOC120682321 isoform X1 [Panicum virgatum]XP_039820094.1 uncharacterized protein LOC120682321 isoform X1 [Panicum virgatum]